LNIIRECYYYKEILGNCIGPFIKVIKNQEDLGTSQIKTIFYHENAPSSFSYFFTHPSAPHSLKISTALVHDGVSLFRPEPLHNRRKSLHVAEHHCDLLALTLNLVSLAQDLLGQALGKITLNFVYLFIKRQVFGGWLSGDS